MNTTQYIVSNVKSSFAERDYAFMIVFTAWVLGMAALLGVMAHGIIS